MKASCLPSMGLVDTGRLGVMVEVSPKDPDARFFPSSPRFAYLAGCDRHVGL